MNELHEILDIITLAYDLSDEALHTLGMLDTGLKTGSSASWSGSPKRAVAPASSAS